MNYETHKQNKSRFAQLQKQKNNLELNVVMVISASIFFERMKGTKIKCN